MRTGSTLDLLLLGPERHWRHFCVRGHFVKARLSYLGSCYDFTFGSRGRLFNFLGVVTSILPFFFSPTTHQQHFPIPTTTFTNASLLSFFRLHQRNNNLFRTLRTTFGFLRYWFFFPTPTLPRYFGNQSIISPTEPLTGYKRLCGKNKKQKRYQQQQQQKKKERKNERKGGYSPQDRQKRI